MSEPCIIGETLFKASWTRTGLRIEQGKVLLANELQFIVTCGDASTESVSQRDTGGWCRTKGQALEHLLSCLGVTLRRVEMDALRLKAKIQNLKNTLAHVAEMEG